MGVAAFLVTTTLFFQNHSNPAPKGKHSRCFIFWAISFNSAGQKFGFDDPKNLRCNEAIFPRLSFLNCLTTTVKYS